MHLALYHPQFGYYRRRRTDPHSSPTPFGSAGDFYTAEQLPPFADLLAAAVERSGHTAVLELGAGRRDLGPALARFQYRGLDWDDPALPDSFGGFILANEFFDALPVHLLSRQNGRWSELGVIVRGDGFGWEPLAAVSPELLAYAERYQQFLPADALLEVNLEVGPWLSKVARCCRSSELLVIDYGYRAPELARFPQGSLLSYRRHAASSDVLILPGERDITAHVNLTEFLSLASQLGFSLLFEGSLQQWALELAQHPSLSDRLQHADTEWRLAFKQLLVGMGESFQVLLFQIPPVAPTSR